MKYSDERREAILKKLLPPHNRTVEEVAKEEGISAATLYNWRKKARQADRLLPDQSDDPEGWSSQDKFHAVLETAALSEAERAEYCQQRGLYPEQIQRWRASCEGANDRSEVASKQQNEARKPDRQENKDLKRELRRKEAALAETAALLALRKKARAIWGGRGRMISTSDRRPQAVRPVPRHALSPEERQQVLEICHRPEFASLPPGQIVPRLLDEEGLYVVSESSYYRILRDHGEQHHRGRTRTPRPKGATQRHRVTRPNACWSWDVTYLPTQVRGQFCFLYMIVDIYSRKIVDAEVFDQESMANSSEVIQRALLREGCINKPLVLHADNGSAMKGSTLQATLQRLNITPSYSRPRVSNDNAFSESLFRTCKYRPDYPADGYESLSAAQQWVTGFLHWYNHEHRHSAIRFVTPVERHAGQDDEVLAMRDAIYAEAKRQHPGRWSALPATGRHVGRSG